MSKFKRNNEVELRQLEQRLAISNLHIILNIFNKILWKASCNVGQLCKRTLDVVIAGTAIITLLPIMLALAVMIKLTDGGPVLYWQTRVGKWGETFRFPKFRSMVMNAEAEQKKLFDSNLHGSGITFKIKNDPRITRIGRFMRKTSMDELPQLWSIIKGDMSLVGPRPALVLEVARYSLRDRRRLDITPGLTCIWQVSGRSDIPFPEQVRMDVEYIQQQSVWYDIKLILKTVPADITGRGAY